MILRQARSGFGPWRNCLNDAVLMGQRPLPHRQSQRPCVFVISADRSRHSFPISRLFLQKITITFLSGRILLYRRHEPMQESSDVNRTAWLTPEVHPKPVCQSEIARTDRQCFAPSFLGAKRPNCISGTVATTRLDGPERDPTLFGQRT
jgi:hypothetical protein